MPAAPVVALVGNPNSGKTTIFNGLSGAFQKVGNYPGVTVERVSATVSIGGESFELVDVPGLYSLEAESEDERVASDVLRGTADGRTPHLVVCVLDGNNLERNLYLFHQLTSLGIPIVAAVTMSDVAAESGKRIDRLRLSEALGVETVEVIGHKRSGLDRLKGAIERALEFRRPPIVERNDEFRALLSQIISALARAGFDYTMFDVYRELAVDPQRLKARVADFPDVHGLIDEAIEAFSKPRPDLEAPKDRYDWAASVANDVVTVSDSRRKPVSESIDRLLVHRVFGLAIFVALMYVVFQSIYTFATPVMDSIDAAFGGLANLAAARLETTPAIESFVVDGLIGGIGAAVIFLPQILILFFFISVLEGTGYLARAAFLMDRLLGWCGLNGRAFIPLLSSYACAIPGIMAARVMPDAKSRLATILVAPLMSCSARLPVYLLLIGTFIEPRYGAAWAGFTLFAMHLLGLVVAIPVVFALNRKVIKGRRLPFVLELPPYQWPRWRDVLITMYLRGKVFLKVAGTMILAMSVLVWALLYFPRSEAAESRYRTEYAGRSEAFREAVAENEFVAERQTEDSYLGRFAQTIAPVFEPAGFDWRITTGILAAFPAREVIVPTLGILFSVGSEVDEGSGRLKTALGAARRPDGSPLMTPWNAVGLMVFFALCAQCMSTLATVKRETNSWKWPVFMFVYMSALAYIAAVLVHQVERLFA